ncbi:methyltransferase domain-containing protein [Streptomyces sp. NPDC087270]|uniref:methyltransferase domain-containing protein n=1 Tax=Streptomyces sp. NPDC087270 TaxID=3365774 RepID=UPI0037F565CE
MGATGPDGRREGRFERRYATAAGSLRARMVRRIESGGGLTDPAWRAAFAEVPRHLFVLDDQDTGYGGEPGPGGEYGGGYDEEYGEEYGEGFAYGEGPVHGRGPVAASHRRAMSRLTGAYADRPIATRVVGGELVSSSSQPSLMALMCEALDVHGGERVLEIGAGTGYNAALLAHRLGPDTVTTIDLEPEITAAARAHLDAYGTEAARSVVVVTGDGALGHPPRAPYDRVIATCELPFVPPAWLEQCTPGGLLLLPLATGLVALTVHGPRQAEGRFLSTPAYFVPLRGGSGAPDGAAEHGLAAEVFGQSAFGGITRPDRTRYGLTVDGPRQWLWRDSPEGPLTWPLTTT